MHKPYRVTASDGRTHETWLLWPDASCPDAASVAHAAMLELERRHPGAEPDLDIDPRTREIVLTWGAK